MIFAFQCGQWELIWNSQLIGRYKEMSPGEFMIYFETGRAQSELFTFQCGQWELIWNSQLIGRYKEMSPGESYDIPPPFETGRAQSELFTFQCSQLDFIWNSQLIGRYKEMSPGESYIWNWQSSRVNSLLFKRSMRAHLKQSTNRKI